MEKPLVVTDGRYLFVHHRETEIPLLGPLNYNPHPTEGGQVDEALNSRDPYGCPVNPRYCVGGRVHKVDNPLCSYEHQLP